MADGNQYELHYAGLELDAAFASSTWSWQEAVETAQVLPFAVPHSDTTVWAHLNEDDRLLHRLPGPQGAEYAFRVLTRRFSTDLAMMTSRHDVLVNGLPALNFTLLTTKDSIRLAPGCMVYVSERISPYVGIATEEHLGRKCPYCKLQITEGTFVAACKCGGLYHVETKENLPDLPDDDRLECSSQVQTCLACGNELVLSEHLLWEPSSL